MYKEDILMDQGRQEKPRCEGYTLFSVPAGNALPDQHATLIDMTGKIVHEWSITGNPAIMLPGGSLIGSKTLTQEQEMAKGDSRPVLARPTRGTVEIYQEGWDGQKEWAFRNWDDAGTGIMMCRLHHDYQREGNPVGYYAPDQDFMEHGKTLILAKKNRVVPEVKGDKELTI